MEGSEEAIVVFKQNLENRNIETYMLKLIGNLREMKREVSFTRSRQVPVITANC